MFARILPALVVASIIAGCGGSSGNGPSCTGNTDCGATEVCAGGHCADALSVDYDVTLSMDIANAEPDGTPWDSDGSPPDVQASLAEVSSGGIDHAPILQWDTDEDYHPSWSAQQAHFTDVPLQLSADDDDSTFGIGSSDPICTVPLGDTVAFLHDGGGSLNATSCRVTLSMVPRD